MLQSHLAQWKENIYLESNEKGKLYLRGNAKKVPNWKIKNISGRIHKNIYPFLLHVFSTSNHSCTLRWENYLSILF